MTDPSGDEPLATAPDRENPPLRWPPPGLERMQGDLGQIAARGALAGGLLVLPLLFVVAREQRLATLGPFADAWWVTIVLTSVGLAFSLDALARTARLLRRTARLVDHGYDLSTVWHVASDVGRDMGFLIQGRRHFAPMDERERSAIARIRIFSVTLHALAGLWLSIAMAVGLLAASRGRLSPMGLWVFTLLPALGGYVFGGVARLVNDTRVRRARRAYHTRPWLDERVADEGAAWRAARAERSRASARSVAAPRLASGLRWAAVGCVALGALIAVPVLTLLPSSAVGPVLSAIATPQFDRARQRAARAEAYRAYAAPVDSAVTPQEAGRLLHDISKAGVEGGELPGERPPDRAVSLPWIPDLSGENPIGIDPFRWGDTLIDVVAAGTTGAQRAYLAGLSTHPLGDEFSRLASAAEVDVAAGRWTTPFPPEVTIATMPLPRFGALRGAAHAHIGSAAYALTRGDHDRARSLLSEVISVGLLLGDDGPTLLDNMIGFSLVEAGGRALEDLFSATGQERELVEIRRVREAAERAADRVPVGVNRTTEAWVRGLPDVVLDTTAVRGLRWEYFIGVASLAPCLNLHRMVFGPDQEYDTFMRAAHDSLVRYPSEEGLFALARGGWLVTAQGNGETWMGRLLAVSMRRGDHSCGDAILRLQPDDMR